MTGTTARIALLQLPAFGVEDAGASLAYSLRRIDEVAAVERPDLIALPEVTYPAYFLGRADLRDTGLLSADEVMAAFAAKAREHGVYVAVGLAVEREDAPAFTVHSSQFTVSDETPDGDDAASGGGVAEGTGIGGTRAESPRHKVAPGIAPGVASGVTPGGAADPPVAARYANGAVLFGRDGAIVGRYEKSFLFHFDTRWFAAGSAYPVFETDIGRIGMLVCADGRLPEIARSLTLNGAQLILNLTAWVSGARRVDELSTPQREFLMPTRAAENGVWIAACDKFGIEADSIVYAGRSCFIDPTGAVVAELGPNEDAALVYDVPIVDAAPRVERRPELYAALSQPTESLPVMRWLDEAFVLSEHERRIAVAQITMPATGDAFVEQARRHVERQAIMQDDLIVFPATPSRLRTAYAHDAVLAGISAIARDTGMMIAFTVSEPDADGWRTMILVGPKGVITTHRQTHKPPGPRFATMPLGDEPSPVTMTPIGRVGLMVAAEGFVPEVARSLMLRGAEFILWCGDDPGSPMMQTVARCRAEENRVFVACAAAPSENGATAIFDPAGRQLAVALERRELVVSADVNRVYSHSKQRAPGTDVVRNRQPETYGGLVGGL